MNKLKTFKSNIVALFVAVGALAMAGVARATGEVDISTITAGLTEAKGNASTIGLAILGIFVVFLIFGVIKMALSKKGG